MQTCRVSGSPQCRGEAAASAAPWNRLVLGLEPCWLPALFLKWSSICLLSTFGRNSSYLNNFTPVFALTSLMRMTLALALFCSPSQCPHWHCLTAMPCKFLPWLADTRTSGLWGGRNTPDLWVCELLKGELSSPLLSCQAGSYSLKYDQSKGYQWNVLLMCYRRLNKRTGILPLALDFCIFITNLCEFACS